jgi:hypothetical protein
VNTLINSVKSSQRFGGARWRAGVAWKTMSQDQRQAGFARMVESGLQHEMFGASDVLSHATPDVLANHLPPELMSKVLSSSLAAGSMTPERVLETVTPDLLAKHLPHDVLWACIAAAAARAGVAR